MFNNNLIKLPYNNRAHHGYEIKTKLYNLDKIFIKENKTGHFSKKEITCPISITKPKVWIEKGYNEK